MGDAVKGLVNFLDPDFGQKDIKIPKPTPEPEAPTVLPSQSRQERLKRAARGRADLIGGEG
jgi:hypothetical protein